MSNHVNILIPFYNAEHSLPETIQSVVIQTSTHWKIIFVNDGSTDGSLDIVIEFLQQNPGKAVLLHSEYPRSGPAICRNIGLRSADAEYLICVDSDDQLEPFCVEQRLLVMNEDPTLDWAVFKQYQSGPFEQKPFKIFNKKVNGNADCIRVFLGMDVAWQTMAPIWKIQSLWKMGGFDENLYPSEDPDLHLRALLNNDLKLKLCYSLPADCYYNIAHKTGEKQVLFYKESILSKIKFMRKTVGYLPTLVDEETLNLYHKYLRGGFYLFLKSFLLVRLRDYEVETWGLIHDLRKASVLSKSDVFRLKIIRAVFTSRSKLVSVFRIKGLTLKALIPPDDKM